MSRTPAPPPLVRNRWWLVTAAGVGVFMAQLDATIVNTALPTLEERLGTTTGVVSWVMLGYTLPLLALALPSGRWLDRVGARAALVFTVGGFVATSVLAGLSPTIGLLIAARVAQGAFGAALFALLPVVASAAVAPSRRGRALGIVFTLGPVGGATGPVLGGLLLDGPGWPWIFYLNVPVGLAVIAIALAQLPRGEGLQAPDRAWFTETALLGSAAVAALLGLTLAAENGLGWLALLPVAIVPALVWRHSKAGHDVRRMWRAPGVAAPLAALSLVTAGLVGAQFLAPFYAERSLSFTPAQTGMALLAIPAGMIAGGPVSGWLADRWNARGTAMAGGLVSALGIVLTVQLGASWRVADLAWRLAVIGLGYGLFAAANQSVAMGSAPADLLGTVSAATSLFRQIGIAAGPSLATILWARSGYTPGGMRIALLLALAAAVLGAVIAAKAPSRSASPTPPDAAGPR